MRDIWQTTNVNYGAKCGLATCPKKLNSYAIKRILERHDHKIKAVWDMMLLLHFLFL